MNQLFVEPPMADFPVFQYSMQQVKKAGEALRGDLTWSEESREELFEVFRIANNWADSHAYPMVRMMHELTGKVRKHKLQGLTVSRLKRMSSIRKKLSRISSKLDQIQDLGGCRSILPSIAAAKSLADAYRDDARHDFHNESDYIAKPKRGGYRCHHLMFKYRGSGEDEVFNGRRIEIQIRTRLQHSWATAVEAVGLFRGEDMKAGEGDADWLRLFDLMSAEFACAEKCPESSHLPFRHERVRELKELNRKLNATGTLETLRLAVRFTETQLQDPMWRPEYYRIEFDTVSHQVRVKPHGVPVDGIMEHHAVEQKNHEAGSNRINTVFVAAGKIGDLRKAFPNYFGDVRLFAKNLKDITLGKGAKEYTMPPQATVPPPPREAPDLSWFRRAARRSG